MRYVPWPGIFRLSFLAMMTVSPTGCGNAERICIETEEIPVEGGCGVCVCKYGAWSCTVDNTCQGSGGAASSGGAPGSGGAIGSGGGTERCKDGTTKSNGCNACLCSNGAWSCTDNVCNGVCSPGTSVEADCGTCSCSAQSQWECPQGCSVQSCQTLDGRGCPRNSYCHYPQNTLCGLAGEGICKRRPSGGCNAINDPVCGCDGKNYPNACEAESMGVTVILKGDCLTAPP